MNSIIIFATIMKLYSCASICSLPDPTTTGFNYYEVRLHNRVAPFIRVRCGHGDYVTLRCSDGVFQLYSFGEYREININTFCGQNKCFTPKVVDLIKTGLLRFLGNCNKHNFDGGKCKIYCITDSNIYMVGTCTKGVWTKTDGNDINLCTEVVYENLNLDNAKEDGDCTGNTCKIKCKEEYESTPGVTTGTVERNSYATRYTCLLKNGNFPQISKGYYLSWNCIYKGDYVYENQCEYVCDEGYVADKTFVNKVDTFAYLTFREDGDEYDAEKNFCIKKVPPSPKDGGAEISGGSEGTDENDRESEERDTSDANNKDENPPGPIVPEGVPNPPTDDGNGADITGGGNGGDNEGENDPKKAAAVFATKSIALELLWLLVFLY